MLHPAQCYLPATGATWTRNLLIKIMFLMELSRQRKQKHRAQFDARYKCNICSSLLVFQFQRFTSLTEKAGLKQASTAPSCSGYTNKEGRGWGQRCHPTAPQGGTALPHSTLGTRHRAPAPPRCLRALCCRAGPVCNFLLNRQYENTNLQTNGSFASSWLLLVVSLIF